MMKFPTTRILLILSLMTTFSPAAEWLPLWTGGIPAASASPVTESITEAGHLTDTAIPAYEVYLPAAEKRNGAAVVIFPGGGYTVLAIGHEGREYARWLNERGIAGIVVKSRVSGNDAAGFQFPAPLLDARRAIRTTRFHAREWGLDSNKIGVMGSSAGGHLASMAATLFDETFPEETGDAIDKLSCRPDFQILVYPVIGMDQAWGHGGSKRRLLGENPDPALVARVASYRHITSKTPPCFLVHSADDNVVPVRNSLEYAASCAENKVPVACHVFNNGGHGYGLKGGGDSTQWPSLLDGWLVQNNLSIGAEKAEVESKPMSAKPQPTADDPNSFIGLTEMEAVEAANRLELPNRIVARDGKHFPVTRDYRPNRLNFVIEKGLVTRVTTG